MFWKPAPTLDYWRKGRRRGNFGDALSLLYMARLFTTECRFSAGTLYLVGSVIEEKRIRAAAGDGGTAPGKEKARAIFWGCGKQRGGPLDPPLLEQAVFLGVRGRHTRDALGLPADTPLGDTAFLLPRFYRPRPAPAATGKVLWVPHTDHADPTPADLAGCPDHLVLRPEIANTAAACERFIDAIAAARFVMANAMHAAVVAMAYGVPFCFWRGGGINMPFKWDDLTSPFGFTMEHQGTYAEGVAEYDRVRPDRGFAGHDLEPLLRVAPYTLRI